MKLIEITEQDRKLKQDYSSQLKSQETGESDRNLITKFFTRP
jgi:hypothetical protein